MNAQELQDLLSDKLGRVEAMELVRFIEFRPDLATKDDMKVLSAETKSYIDQAIGSLAWKVAGFLVAQAAVIVTLIKLL